MTTFLHAAAVLALSPAILLALQAPPQNRPDPPADATVYAVAYVEAMATSRGAAVAALKQYRETSRGQDGYGRVDVFEQVGRPGHFAIFEVWRDQKAFDAHEAAAQKPLVEKLQPIRTSGYDQRFYKTLAVGPAPTATTAPAGRGAISVVTHVDVTPNSRVAALLTEFAEASRRERGNVRFDVVQHTMRANHFTIVETWQGEEAHHAHVAAGHSKQYRDELQPLTGSPLDERIYKAVE